METCNYNCNNYDKYIDSEINDYNNYNDFFLKTNNNNIISKINNLFLDKFFYTKSEIISFLSTIKNYSLSSINNALTELVENSNYIVKDKYGKNGKIINIDELYIFQPLEINYENTSMYNRIAPINYHNDSLVFKVQDSIKKPIDKKMYTNADIKIVDKLEDSQSLKDKKEYLNINVVFENIYNEYNSIINNDIEYLNKIKSKNSNIKIFAELIDKYKNLFDLSDKILLETDIQSNKINKKELIKIIIQILLDKLNFDSHKSIIEYIFNESIDKSHIEKDELKNNIFLVVKEYYNNIILITDKLKGFIFDPLIINKKDKEEFKKKFNYNLFVLDNNKLLHGTPLNYSKDFTEIINSNKINLSNYSNSLGFIKIFDIDNDNNTKYNYIFKIKDLKDPSNKNGNYNSGKVCTSHSQNDLKTILNNLNIRNFPTKFPTKYMCLFVEIILRYFDNIKNDDKKWFFNIKDSLINNF